MMVFSEQKKSMDFGRLHTRALYIAGPALFPDLGGSYKIHLHSSIIIDDNSSIIDNSSILTHD